MILTNVRIERPEGTIVQSSVMVQLDTVMPDPKSDLGQDRDFVLFDAYFAYVPLSGVRRRDVLVDLLNTDALTGALARYRVTLAETFDNDHVEARCQSIIGD